MPYIPEEIEIEVEGWGIVDDWTQASYSAGAEWRDAWPEPTPGRGSMRIQNTDGAWQRRSLEERYTPRTVTASVFGETLFTGELQPMSPSSEGRPEFGVAGPIASPNRDKFARTAQWSNIETAGVHILFTELLETFELSQGSVVLGRQQLGPATWDNTVRGLLSEFSRAAGALVCEDRLGNIDCIHWGLASQHVGLTLDAGVEYVSEQDSVAYRRDIRTHSSVESTRAVQLEPHPLGSVDEQILPGERTIVEVGASGKTLIDAQWDDPEPYLGLEIRVITKQPRTLVLEVRNTTDTVIAYQIDFTGSGVYARSEEIRELESRYAGVVPRETLRMPPWFSTGGLSWGAFTFGFYTEGIAWARFALPLGQGSLVPRRIQPGVVFEIESMDALSPPTPEWLCHRTEWRLANDGSTQSYVIVEALGLPDQTLGARWGRARWGRDRWHG